MNTLAIAPEILALRNAKPAEKLLLALYADSEQPTNSSRTLGMTIPGRKKVQRRLVAKGWLVLDDHRGTLKLPPASHSVPKSKPVETGNKVAAGSPVKVYSQPLLVHAELLDFHHLSASEKLVIAFYAAHPDATNVAVASTVGLSLSGLKKVKATLLGCGVLTPAVDGFAIRLPKYIFVRDADGGHFVSEPEAINSGYKVTGPAPQLTPAAKLYAGWKKSYAWVLESPTTSHAEAAAYYTNLIQRIECESPGGIEKMLILETVTAHRDRQIALQYVVDYVPRVYQPKFVQMLKAATTQQLAALCGQIKDVALTGQPDSKQLSLVANLITEHAGGGVQSSSVHVIN